MLLRSIVEHTYQKKRGTKMGLKIYIFFMEIVDLIITRNVLHVLHVI